MAEQDARRYFRLNTDGGVVPERGKASGEGAIGVVLVDPDEHVVHEISDRIGHVGDHHIAEYRALIAGLRLAFGHGISCIRAYVDSKLITDQMKGESRVGPDYLVLWRDAQALAGQFDDFDIELIPRKENKSADALASSALKGIGK